MGPNDRFLLEEIADYCQDIEDAISELDIDYDSFRTSAAKRGAKKPRA